LRAAAAPWRLPCDNNFETTFAAFPQKTDDASRFAKLRLV